MPNPSESSATIQDPTVDRCIEQGRRALSEARERLEEGETVDIRSREAYLLLGSVLGWNEAQVRARGDRIVDHESAAQYRELLARRSSGEPMAYVLGEREFYGRPFRVDSRVLIPRPETEHLVEVAVNRLSSSSGAPRVLDVGTGSGCIAVTLACELPACRVVATDVSPAALEVARGNSRALGVRDRVHGLCAHLATGLDLSKFDLMVSNPPYVSPSAARHMSPEVLQFEPHGALFAEEGGLALIRELLDTAEGLRSGVEVLVEIGFDQAERLREEVGSRPFLSWRGCLRDYAGHPRLVMFSRA